MKEKVLSVKEESCLTLVGIFCSGQIYDITDQYRGRTSPEQH